MDPLSVLAISTGVAQLVQSSGALAKGLSRFVLQTKNLPDSIQEIHDEIESLRVTVGTIKKTLDKRPQQLPFERDHHANIHRIVLSCHASLKTLGRELPELNEKTGNFEKMRHSIEFSLKQDRIKQLLHHISSYKTILQLSLTTLTLGAMSETRSSQKQIQFEIRKLTDAIRQSPHLFSGGMRRRDIPLVHVHGPDAEVEGEEQEESSLDKEIRDWRKTADDVATAVSLNDFDGASVDTHSIPPNSSVSVDTLPLYEEDTYDPEPNYRDSQNSEILIYQLKENQKIVRELIQCGIFVKAAWYQQRGIELIKQLMKAQARTETDEFTDKRLADMKEELADILLQCGSEENGLEAKTVIQQLLEEEVNRGEGQVDENRRARLYHKLGELYFRQGNNAQARRFLGRALDIRKRIEPMPCNHVEESAELLVQILQQSQALDEARGLREWIRSELHQDARLSLPSLSSLQITYDRDSNVGIDLSAAYQWCKEQGMDLDSETFSFSDCDPESGMTPMHRAVQAENIDVLRHMLSNVSQVELRDASGSTLLHVAAAKRNRHICSLLLEEYQANPQAEDRNGRTPLHRCQTGSGGVQVAEMLLEHCPDLIDRVDGFGKTALYMACEKGNENMVKCLLSKGRAKPDITGPGKCTPLLVAIDLAAQISRKIAIVELLLKHGAEPNIADADGRTAFTAAKNAGLAGSEIKRMLSMVPSRRISTATVNSRTSAGGRRKSSSSSGIFSLAESSQSR